MNFEQPLEGEGKSVAEIFKADESIFSCFVRGDTVVVYKHYLQVGSFKIDNALNLELPAEFSNVFEPLELIHNDGKLLLTAKVGSNGDNHSMVAVFDLDFRSSKS